MYAIRLVSLMLGKSAWSFLSNFIKDNKDILFFAFCGGNEKRYACLFTEWTELLEELQQHYYHLCETWTYFIGKIALSIALNITLNKGGLVSTLVMKIHSVLIQFINTRHCNIDCWNYKLLWLIFFNRAQQYLVTELSQGQRQYVLY